jgi:hypothetical protein
MFYDLCAAALERFELVEQALGGGGGLLGRMGRKGGAGEGVPSFLFLRPPQT